MSIDEAEKRRFDCVFCGEICVDIPIRTVDRERPLASVDLIAVEPIRLGCGGSVPNSGIAFAKIGLRGAAFGCVGDDGLGKLARGWMRDAGMDVSRVCSQRGMPTSATAVLGGHDGEHTFAYHNGASRAFDKSLINANLDLFDTAKFALFGYYGLMPQLEEDLADLLAEIRARGCKTALDAAGGGGALQPLDRILPHLDVYIPSLGEARQQTGKETPREMIKTYREFCPSGLLGVKLGARGALLQTADGDWIDVEPIRPRSPVVDTTGAGDCFYAGLIAALVQGLAPAEAGRIAAAAGACSVTAVGAASAMRTYEQLVEMAH